MCLDFRANLITNYHSLTNLIVKPKQGFRFGNVKSKRQLMV